MAGNNSIVYTGEVQIGATFKGKYDLLRAAGFGHGQVVDILGKTDYLSMPRERGQTPINAPRHDERAVVVQNIMADSMKGPYSQTPYPSKVTPIFNAQKVR